MGKYIDMIELNQKEINIADILICAPFYLFIVVAHCIWWLGEHSRDGIISVLTMEYYPGKWKYKKM